MSIISKFKINSKLSIQILTAVVLCSSILTLFSSMVQLYFDYKKGLNTIHENIHFIQTSYLPSIISGVYALDEKQVESLLKGCLNFPDIKYLEITDTSNLLYKSAGNKSISKDITQGFPLEYTTPSGKVISLGTLTLFASVKGLYHRLWEKAYIILFSNMIKTFFAAILILMIINHILVRHLIKISKFTRNLNLDKLCQKLKLNRQTSKIGAIDELDQLVQSINLMIENIKSDADKIKKIQNSLQESEEYLKSILNSAENVAFVITDLSGENTKILDFSPGAEKIFGFNRNEILGKKVGILHPPEIVDQFSKMQANLIKSHTGYSGETVLVKKSGQHFPALFTIYPKFDNSGNIDGTIGVSIDISERKQAEDKLILSSSRYHSLFQQSPIPLWEEDFTELVLYLEELREKNVQNFRKYIDENPSFLEKCSQKVKILDVNQEALKLHNAKSREELLGNLDKIFTEKSFETFKEEIISISKGVFEFESEGEVKTLSGERKSIFLKMTIEKEWNDSYIALIATIDVTDRNQMEARLMQAQKMESIGSLAGGIAHDFNNLLFPILGMSEILLEDLPKDSLEYENTKEIFLAGTRAADLVQQILAFSRQSEHKMTPTRIQTVLKEALKLCRSTIPSNIEIHENIQTKCGLVMADPTQVHQIAMNLITNAFHAVQEKNGTIDIELRQIDLKENEIPDSVLQPGQYVRLSVSDNGTGISQSSIHKIFEPYFTTKEKGKGTGFGLAVVYGIVKEHKGEIKVYSEMGKGTTFNVYLPLMKKFSEITIVDNLPKDLVGTESILLVDDEVSVAKLEGQMLSRLGYKVIVKTDSKDALNVFQSNPDSFDLVISDMTMPDMTGDQLSKEILSIRPDLPIIICTGFSERINKEQAEMIGVKGFLMKPVIKFDMAQMVRNVLDAI